MIKADKRRFEKRQKLKGFYRRPSAFIIAQSFIFEFYSLKRQIP
jgi:hypothetical protein